MTSLGGGPDRSLEFTPTEGATKTELDTAT
jgi:hypothetical protein